MFFRKKLDRAQKWLRERTESGESIPKKYRDEELPSMEELREEADRLPLEKGDLPALIFSAMITFIPVCLIALLILCSVALLLL